MGAIKILSANDVKRIAGTSWKQYKRVQWHSAEIIVRPVLSVEEYMEVIELIVSDCIGKDGNIMPELIDFAKKINIISAYASIELPKSMVDVYYIIYASDLYDTVTRAVSAEQINSIITAVNVRILRGMFDEKKI